MVKLSIIYAKLNQICHFYHLILQLGKLESRNTEPSSHNRAVEMFKNKFSMIWDNLVILNLFQDLI